MSVAMALEPAPQGRLAASAAGTGQLVRLILRRDRIRLPLWLLGYAGLIGATVPSVRNLYDTPEKIAGYGATVTGSAAGRFLNGRPYDVDTLGGIVGYELSSTAAVVVTLMVVFLVVRHTRAEEESGRAELLRGSRLGRHAHTTAAVLVAVAMSVAIGAIDALLLVSAGLDPVGSLLHGASLAGLGIVFTAVTALAAQVTASARAALGIAGGALGVLFAVRGAGDVDDTFWTWLSPFGWAQAVRPYGDPRWWPVVALLGCAAVLFAGAAYLTSRRDQGAGLLQPRPGNARGSARLGTGFGLALRLQRGLLIGWLVGLVATAALFGSFGGEVEEMVATNDQLGDIFAAGTDSVLDGYFAYIVGFLGVLTSAFTLSSALRLRSEETGRAEPVFATRISRLRWAGGSLAVTLLGTMVALLAVGVAIGGAHALGTGDTDRIGPSIVASLAQAPAILLVAAVGVGIYGWAPRWALLAWIVFGFAMVQNYLGGLLRLPDAIAGLSPFWHLAQLPVDHVAWWPILVELGLAAALTGAGLARLRDRDLEVG